MSLLSRSSDMSEILNVTDEDRFMSKSNSSSKSDEKSKSLSHLSCSIGDPTITFSQSIEVEQHFSCRSEVSEKSEPEPIFLDSSDSATSDKSKPNTNIIHVHVLLTETARSENSQTNANKDQESEIKPEDFEDIEPDCDQDQRSPSETKLSETSQSNANENRDQEVIKKHETFHGNDSKSIAKDEKQASSESEVSEGITNADKGHQLDRTEMSAEESKINVKFHLDLSSYSERSQHMTADEKEEDNAFSKCSEKSSLLLKITDSQVDETDEEYSTTDSETNEKSNFRVVNSIGSSENSRDSTTMTRSETISTHGSTAEGLESGYSYGSVGSSFLESLSEDFEDKLELGLFASCFAQACGIPEKTFSCDPRDREDRLNKPSLLVESNGKRYTSDAYDNNQKEGIIRHLKKVIKREQPRTLIVLNKDDKKLKTVQEDDRFPLSHEKGETSTSATQDCPATPKSKRSDSKEKTGCNVLVITQTGDVKHRGFEKECFRKKRTDKSVSGHDENMSASPVVSRANESIDTGVNTPRAGTLSRPKALLSARDKMEIAMLERQKRTPESPSFKLRKEVRLTNKKTLSTPLNPWSVIDEHAEKKFGVQSKKGKQKSGGDRRKKTKNEGDRHKKKKRHPLNRTKHRSSTEKKSEKTKEGRTE